MPGKSFVENPHCPKHKIERREFYIRDSDFVAMTKAVPFPPCKDPVAQCWYQTTSDGAEVFCVGVPTKTPQQRMIQPLLACDRKMVPGDAPDTLIEARAFRSSHHQQFMYGVRPRGHVPGYACMAWWEVPDVEKPNEGIPTLCIGLVPTKEGLVLKDASDDNLESKSLAQLQTEAGKLGVKYDSAMKEGELIARIREAVASKSKKKSKPEPAAV